MDKLLHFITHNQPLFVLTGAGCSTASGIPDYRGVDGKWKNAQPVQYQEFINSAKSRQMYWARSYFGWPKIRNAEPNPAHISLAQLEQLGFVTCLVTQNVDNLHQKAGHRVVANLHGSISEVRCLDCATRYGREKIQKYLVEHNSEFIAEATNNHGQQVPDGDMRLDLNQVSLLGFTIPNCERCGGVLKPDVVFFGEMVPKQRVNTAFAALAQANGVLIVGSSLVVYSGYRFCRKALQENKPVAAINLGYTRADADLDLKMDRPCAEVLSWVMRQLREHV